MNVRTGAPMVPMSGMPPNPMMPNQPMNMLPPPMPVPPIVPPQAAGTFPVNKDRRKRFGDSLETMLSRPPMVASDQMGGMNVFTGQMMNTAARPPVVRMRRGGDVRDMYRQAYSSPEFKAAQSAASRRNPGRTGAMTHSDLMSKIRGGSSPGDDRPAPVKMSFGDEDYTPTSAELNQELLDIGAPDKRFDVVPNAIKNIYGGMGDLDAREKRTMQALASPSLAMAQMPRGTGGLSSVPSVPSTTFEQIEVDPGPIFNIPVIDSGMPNTGMTAGPAYSPAADPNVFISDVFESSPSMQFGDQPVGALPVDPSLYVSDVFETPDPMSLQEASFDRIGLGDPEIVRPKIRPQGGGEEKDDRGFVEKLVDDVKAVPGNIMRDLRMGIDAGFYTDFEVARQRLMDTGKYTKEEVDSWVQRTKDTVERNKRQTQGQSTDDDSPMSTSPVDPCPPGFKLDPVSGICVPIEEAEEEGPSLDLNRTRDDEFNELDDIMKRIVKPVNEARILPISPMQAGGSVGLNRAADNFLAAMGA